MMRLCSYCKVLVEAKGYDQHMQRHRFQQRERPGSTRAWRKLRQRVLERDGHRCRACGATSRLEIHHISGDWSDNRPENLITVCFDHNPRGPTTGQRWPGRDVSLPACAVTLTRLSRLAPRGLSGKPARSPVSPAKALTSAAGCPLALRALPGLPIER